MFQCLCWGQVLSKHLRSAAADPSCISSSSCSVSILASLVSQKSEKARHVCFTPQSRHVQCTSRCLLRANSGHSFVRAAGLVEYLNFPPSHVVGYVVLDCNGVPGANCFHMSDR